MTVGIFLRFLGYLRVLVSGWWFGGWLSLGSGFGLQIFKANDFIHGISLTGEKARR